MELSNSPKRLVIFLFYDKDGIVDSYIPYMLKDVKENVSRIFVVSNGKVNDEGKKRLDGIADEIFERENKGFDVWGYKEALEKIGWDALEEYDELVMMNYTIMGPVYPFKEMFDAMAERKLDFWGITKYHYVPYDPFGKIECGYIPEHLQSHFIAVRKNMFMSEEFRNYWEEMPMIHSYEESISFHETKFTPTFADLGYQWEPYVDSSEYEGMCYHPIIYYPTQLIKQKRCPIFKRRNFMHNYEEMVHNSAGESGYELMKFLREQTDYDTDMIWENLLRCDNMYDIKNGLQLNYILPEKSTIETEECKAYLNKKVAVVFHAYFPDLIESTYSYINNMPANVDVYITTNTEEKKKLFTERFKDHKFNKLEVILIENRGRDVSALLVATKAFIMNYDYVCFAHDKKVTQIEMGSVGASFAYHCLENVLGSEGYIKNVINLFEENPRLGLLTPMPPIHADYTLTIGNDWGPNYLCTVDLAKRLDLNVSIKEDVPPVAPLGTMFWFRPSGMKKLFDVDWEYSDFPKEPNGVDGTLLHAIERIYSFVVQDAGLYCAWCFNDKYAAITVSNLSYYHSEFNKVVKKVGVEGSFLDSIARLENRALAGKSLEDAASFLSEAYPQMFGSNVRKKLMKLYYNDKNGFNEKHSIIGKRSITDGKFSCRFDFKGSTENIIELRFDPSENGFIKIKNISVEYWLKDELVKVNKASGFNTNGTKSGLWYVFINDDPQIIWDIDGSITFSSIVIKGSISYEITSDDICNINKKTKYRSLVKRALKKMKNTLKGNK